MRASRWLLLVGLTFLIGGCAFTDATLKVGYAEALAGRGPLAAIPPMRVDIGSVEDRRPERDKIGYKRNGFNQKTAKITTEKAVPDIVREALAIELAKNGHVAGGPGDDLVLSGELTDFWFDMSVGFFSIDFVASTSFDLALTDRKAGSALYRRTYRGYHKETALGGLEGTWQQVMNTALEQMMREVGTDIGLARAFSRARPR